jgi:hypothetical protein
MNGEIVKRRAEVGGMIDLKACPTSCEYVGEQ